MDIAMDINLLDNDILCLTEKQLETNDDTLPVESILKRQYRMYSNTNVNKFKSIAYNYSNQITIMSNENFNVISIFTLRKQEVSNTPILIVIIYRLPRLPLFVIIDSLQYLVARNIYVILGDFNTDGFEK